MDNIDSTEKIQFTTEVAKDVSGFLDLRLKFGKESKRISVDIFAKTTKSFTYILPLPCFLKNNIEDILKGVELFLRRICGSDSKVEQRCAEHQKYLIARDYKSSKFK